MKPISVAQPDLRGNERRYVNECFDSTQLSHGDFVTRFETDVALYCRVKHGVATTSGTTALHLALAALDIGPGDEVIVPTLSFIAVANAVHYVRATPVFVEADARNYNLDLADLAARISPRTKAIIAVHLYGHPVDMDRIRGIADPLQIAVIEDAAEGHGAEVRGRRAGGMGRLGIFSFYGNKIITTGEGGMVVTDDTFLAGRLRLLRGQGQSPTRRYWFPQVGFNYRMTNLCAAVGVAQMERIEEGIIARAHLAEWYAEELRDLYPDIALPETEPWAKHVFWMYTISLNEGGESRRDRLMAHLAQAGIETRPVFYPLHTQPPYRDPKLCFPVAERLAAHGINLPTHAFVTREDVARIGRELRAFLE